MRPCTFVVVVLALSLSMVQSKKPTRYCPAKSNDVCIRADNECCSNADCSSNQICCSENCGNKCYQPVSVKTTGTMAISQGCVIGP